MFISYLPKEQLEELSDKSKQKHHRKPPKIPPKNTPKKTWNAHNIHRNTTSMDGLMLPRLSTTLTLLSLLLTFLAYLLLSLYQAGIKQSEHLMQSS